MTPSCDALAPLLTRQLLGLLSETELDAVERHLETCPTCPELKDELGAAHGCSEDRTSTREYWDAVA